MPWLRACRADEVTVGTITRQRVNGSPVALTRLPDDSVVAFENLCPHAGGPLALGTMRGNQVVCPWHFFRFDLKTGETVGADQSIMRVKVFSVNVKNGEVFVDA